MFEIKKNPRKIAILGTGDGWNLFPLQSDHTIYCLNDYVNIEQYQIKPDILFIMDVLDEKPMVVAGKQNLQDTIDKINKLDIPLIAPFRYAEIPKSFAFPLRQAMKHLGIAYFTNTISYMIAFALLAGAAEIDIYGVNQASSSEYFYEKSGVEYWLGVANGLGVQITINGAKSELLSNKARFGGGLLYGYNQTAEQVLALEQKFGVPVVHKLLAPGKPASRTVRKVN